MSSLMINSNDSIAYDQILFLEKLRDGDKGCEIESSFVHSGEFNSILKQFKREKQKLKDEKKWDAYQEKKLHQQIKMENSGTKSFFFKPINCIQEHGNFTCQNLNLPENVASRELGECENNWLNDTFILQGTNCLNNQENENKYQITCDIKDSSFVSLNNKLQTGHSIAYIDEDYNKSNHLSQNDGCSNTIVKEIHYECSSFQNEELIGNEINFNEQNIYCHDIMADGLNITEQKNSYSSNEISLDRNSEFSILSENNDAEMHTNAAASASKSDPEPVNENYKTESIHLVPNRIVPANSDKKIENKLVEDENPTEKNCYINEPEKNYCKNVAKKIQDIPGVDNELRKVEDIRIKMTPILANIKIAISKNVNSPLSSDEDLERIKQRTLEFGARFKRNYLYRTNCQVNELKEMLPSPLLITKKSKVLLVIQKLKTAHHAVIQALQVIEKQLQTISIFGKTQELMCSFYNCIYELTLSLKPFYGYLKAQVLDEVEKHLIETLDLLKNLKLEDKFFISNKTLKQKKTQLKPSTEPPPWMKKSAALARLKFGPPIRVRKHKNNQQQKPKILESKQIQNSIIGDQENKCDREQNMINPINFMMTVKQRPGAELRRANFNPVKTEEPKTMIEIISREGSPAGVQDILEEALPTSKHVENNKIFYTSEAIAPKEKSGKVGQLDLVENIEPRNVKLICIKRETEPKEKAAIESRNILKKGSDGIVQWNDLFKYKRAFKKYKKINPLYEKNTLNTVVSMSEMFLEETLTAVSKEINKMKIADLGIVEEVEC